MEVIEGGPGPGPPLLAGGVPEPLTLEGGPFVRGQESHRGAVVLVLSLLFCDLEEYRAGTGPDSMACPRVQWREGAVVQAIIWTGPQPSF